MNVRSSLVTLLAAWVGAADAQPVVTSLTPSTIPRSGRLVISGSGFTTTRGTVLVDGLAAFTTMWTDTRVVAFIPEAARLGSVPVQVVTAAGSSNPAPVNVTLRERDGRVRWRFRGDALYSVTRPALGPDGTIYAVDVNDTLYALAPNGALKWLVVGAGDKGVDVLPDGSVVTGTESFIRAYRPDGTLRWSFEQNPRAFILLGPNVGPDGNVYAVATQGMGILSLTSGGDLRWTAPESYMRPIVTYQELVFGRDGSELQLYFHANDHFKGVRCSNGNTRFSIPGGQSQPAVGPDGTIYAGGLARYSPDGTLLSTWVPFPNNGSNGHDVGSNGRVFFAYNSGWLISLTPNLTPIWNIIPGNITEKPMVDPHSRVVVSGGAAGYGMSGYLQAHNTQDGRLLWRVALPEEIGNFLVIGGRPRFTPDGRVVYFPVKMFGPNPEDVYWYIYALDVFDTCPGQGPGACGPGDWNEDGTIDFNDLLAYLNDYLAASACADLNGDGVIDFNDLLEFVNRFNTPC